MYQLLESYHLLGLAIGICSFLTIGVFHPIVIKAEYHWGVRCWWAFALVGVLLCAASLLCCNVLASAVLAVAAFSCFWGILELFQQQERVHKGWFPRNPRRSYPWDSDNDSTITRDRS